MSGGVAGFASARLADCRCARWKQTSCSGTATQEDLLCDACRLGCSLVRIGGGESFHGRMIDFKFAVPPPAGWAR